VLTIRPHAPLWTTSSFLIDGEELPTMAYEDHYGYLGCQLGANHRVKATTAGNIVRLFSTSSTESRDFRLPFNIFNYSM